MLRTCEEILLYESAKLHTPHASWPTCSRVSRTLCSTCSAYPRASRASRSTCLRASHASCLVCFRTSRALVSHVPRASCALCSTCSSTSLALVPLVPCVLHVPISPFLLLSIWFAWLFLIYSQLMSFFWKFTTVKIKIICM